MVTCVTLVKEKKVTQFIICLLVLTLPSNAYAMGGEVFILVFPVFVVLAITMLTLLIMKKFKQRSVLINYSFTSFLYVLFLIAISDLPMFFKLIPLMIFLFVPPILQYRAFNNGK